MWPLVLSDVRVVINDNSHGNKFDEVVTAFQGAYQVSCDEQIIYQQHEEK